jgi:hypothetical protein
MKKPHTRFFLFLFIPLSIFIPCERVFAQKDTLSWWKPSDSKFPVVEGQAWASEMQDSLHRFPPRAEPLVRKPVWNLSRNSAGLSIRFISNAPQIVVRYKVSGNLSMPHMPSTGVSGVDLYAIDSDGAWHYCAGKYSLKDTIQYNFDKIKPNDQYHKLGREYRLYLPLYNSIRDLEIGVSLGSDRIENVLWRVYHEELDGIEPDKIVINIGTNNLLINTDEEIINGLDFLIKAIKIRQPKAKVYLLGLYPRRNQ